MSSVESEQLRRKVGSLAIEARRAAERFCAEMEFARGLARLEASRRSQAKADADDAGHWRKLIDGAWKAVAEAASSAESDRLVEAVEAAERRLAPIGRVAKTYTVHCVGHAHIDMNWMWSWPETVAVTNDTFLTVLKLMEEFPDFCFTQSQASVYAIVRDYVPELLEPIRRRVAEGRWEVAAVHWVEGDKNLVSGESLARHLLYTRRFVKELFGLSPEDVPLDWEPDTFGHALTIPTIISRGGVRRYYLCRGGPFEKPPAFWWQGPDGSRVLVNRETTWYNGAIDPSRTGAMLSFCEQTGLRDWMCVYGVGDHGGGPTRRDVLRAHEMDSWPIYPNFRLTTTGAFFEVLESAGEDLPVLTGELNFEFSGCYTTQTAIKKGNRYSENHLVEAELAAALGRRAFGREYPTERLRRAWIDTLFGHFHDILPGSGVPATRRYQTGLYQKVAATTGMVKTRFLRELASAVDTSFAGEPAAAAEPADAESAAMGAGAGRGAMDGGISAAAHVAAGPRPFVVFNPRSWPAVELVQASIWDAGGDAGPGRGKGFVVRTPTGQVLPAQRVGGGDYWGHRFVDVVFPVEVGPLGFAAYVVDEGRAEGLDGEVKTSERSFGGGQVGPLTMENAHLEVALDRRTGGVVKLLDKARSLNLADPARPLGVLEYVLERPRGMSAWIIGDPQRRICPVEVHCLQWLHRGPHLASVVAHVKLGDSTISVTYSLGAGQPWLEVDVSATWVERGGPEVGTPSLRMRFPLALADAKARYEVPFGSVQRDLSGGEEVPALRWADVQGRCGAGGAVAGCALLNDSKYGHSLDGSTLALTLIRSSYSPDPLPEIGEHRVRMALAPHGQVLAAPQGTDGDSPACSVADLVRLGAGFNHPVQVIATDVHAGRLGPAGAAIESVRPYNVILSSVKKAEDDDGVIFRLFEADGRAAEASVRLDGAIWGQVAEAVEVDLLERPLAGSTARADGAGFTAAVPAHGITSVKVV